MELCNKLYKEIMESRAKYGDDSSAQWQNALAETLKECVSYVSTHFSSEEKYAKAKMLKRENSKSSTSCGRFI